jgi:hypothetical protein
MATPTEKSIVAELMALVEGLEKNLPNKSFVSASQSYTGPEVIAEVRAIHAAASAVVEARGTLTDALRTNAKVRHDKAEFKAQLRVDLKVFDARRDPCGLSPRSMTKLDGGAWTHHHGPPIRALAP